MKKSEDWAAPLKNVWKWLRIISHIDRNMLPLMFLQALLRAAVPLCWVIFPSMVIEEVAAGRIGTQLILGIGLCAAMPVLLRAAEEIVERQTELAAKNVQDRLEARINHVHSTMPFYELEGEKSQKELAEIREVQYMHGPITDVFRSRIGGMVTDVVSILSYAGILSGIAVEIAGKTAGSIGFLAGVLLFCAFIHGMQKKNLKQKNTVLAEFAPVQKWYGYYARLRGDRERGMDIRVNHLKDLIVSKLEKYNQSERAMFRKYCRYDVDELSMTRTRKLILTLAGYIYAMICFADGRISAGGVYLFANAAAAWAEGLADLIGKCMEVRTVLENYEPLRVLIQTEKAGSTGRSSADVPEVSAEEVDVPALEFRNVYYRYPTSDEWILENISFRLKKGEHISLAGRNGAGKSTLLKLAMGLYLPQKGEILIGGKAAEEMSPRERMQVFTTVFQDFRLPELTVAENVSATEIGNRDRILLALRLCGLDTVIGEEDLNRRLGKKFAEDGMILSGGQQQKLAIARALYKGGEIAFFDEPSAALDPIADAEIQRMIEKEFSEDTYIFVSHRMSSCVRSDRILFLAGGKISEEGTHRELLEKNGEYAHLWKTQAKDYLNEA